MGSESDEVGVLIEKAYERLDAARDLFDDGHYEDAVSRAYYSMVAAATAALLAGDSRVKTHKGLKTLFNEKLVKSGELDERLGKLLLNAEEMRNRADYMVFSKITKEQAESVMVDAEGFVSRIDEFLKR